MLKELRKGNKTIYVNGVGYSLNEVTTFRNILTIEELAYICIKSGKGSFITMSKVEEEAEEQGENVEFYEEMFYQNNECYSYCDMSSFGLENGYLLIENLISKSVEICS